ncbi:MAG TPA: hypothetical protein VLJ41_08490 [Segetibacter sp.]|nr:hypothetical protein [Segetibacter sp.]
MEKKASLQKSRAGICNYKSPLLFSIPLDIYSDEVDKNRDKDLFLKMKNLSKKFEQLKEKFHSYTERHAVRIEVTRSIVLQTLEVGNKLRAKKSSYNRHTA